MSYEVHDIPATEPPMARLEQPDEPDAWIAADRDAFVSLAEATDDDVREAIEELEASETEDNAE